MVFTTNQIDWFLMKTFTEGPNLLNPKKIHKFTMACKIKGVLKTLSDIYDGAFRSSHRRCSVRKGVIRNFAKFAGKHLCQSLFFNKVFLLKKRLWHRCFPVNFTKFLRTPFLRNTSGRLLLSFLRKYETDEIH